MTSIWTDDIDSESGGYDDSEADGLFGESDFDSEDFDAEASNARRRQARARRVALARRRQALGRARSGAQLSTTGSAAQRAASAVRTLDLETKVQEDTFRNAIAAQNKRLSRGEYAAVAGAAVTQFIDSFDTPENPYAKAALRFSPLLLLSPARKGAGIEGLIKDPRVIGAAAVAGLVIVGERRKQSTKAKDIQILAPSQIAKGAPVTLWADVVDKDGHPLAAEKVTWESSQTGIASIDPNTGVIDTKTSAGGSTVITATSGNIKRRIFLTVTTS
jgi:hypothetical protein